MKEIGAYQARTHLPHILERVERASGSSSRATVSRLPSSVPSRRRSLASRHRTPADPALAQLLVSEGGIVEAEAFDVRSNVPARREREHLGELGARARRSRGRG
jgi:hypothetical protein